MKQNHLKKIAKYGNKLKVIYIDPEQAKISSSRKQDQNCLDWKMPPPHERFLKPKKNDPL
jgi:hypothetical protein